jgi:drug/metabolite transporter (DMT)-like permease
MNATRGLVRKPTIPVSEPWGIALAMAVAVVSGVSVFVNGFAVKQLPDAAVYTTLKNGVAAILLIAVAVAVVPRGSILELDRRAWSSMAVIGVIGGSVPFILFFSGLTIASAPSAAFIHKTLFVWVVLLAVPFLGERLGWFPILALGILLAGQLLAAPPTGVSWGTGETMILGATLLWAIEVVVARRLLVGAVPSPVVGAARLGIGLLVLIGYLALTGRFAVVAALTPTQWAWGLGTGILLAAYVGTWLAALRRAPASVVASVLVLGAPITAALTALSNDALPAPPVLAGQSAIVLGAGILAALAVRAGRLRPVVDG